MVKFEKYLTSHIKTEWEDNYVNFQLLKSKIMELKAFDKDQVNAKNENNKNGDEEGDYFYKNDTNLGLTINEFLSLLASEIQKFNLHYLKLEKQIKEELKETKLHTNIITITVKDLLKLIDDIEKVSDDTLEICHYINLNITAIRKVLKKFDKKFDLRENPIALHYIEKNLKQSNSSLVYILKFKIVDQTSATFR